MEGNRENPLATEGRDAGGRREAGPPAGGTALPLALGIASALLCFAVPFGLLAIVFALTARSAATPEVAKKRARLSLVFSALGAVLGGLVELFGAIRHLAAGFQ